MLPLCLAVRGNVVPDHGAPALPLVLHCGASQILAMNSNVLPEFKPKRKKDKLAYMYKSHSQMLGKVESGGGSIFKVVLEC